MAGVQEDIKEVDDRIDGIFVKLEEWSDIQDQKRAAYENHITEKIESIQGAINQKVEMDAVILSKYRDIKLQVDKMEVSKEADGKTLAVVAVQVGQMLEKLSKYDIGKMSTDIDAAHTRISKVETNHEPRIRNLETRGGKWAAKILYALGLTGAGSILGWFLSLKNRG